MPKALSVTLREGNGDSHKWTVVFKPLPPDKNGTVYGAVSFAKRTMYINSRLRNRETILETIRHECEHVALGPGAAEWAMEACDENYYAIKRRVFNG